MKFRGLDLPQVTQPANPKAEPSTCVSSLQALPPQQAAPDRQMIRPESFLGLCEAHLHSLQSLLLLSPEPLELADVLSELPNPAVESFLERQTPLLVRLGVRVMPVEHMAGRGCPDPRMRLK